MEPAIPTETMNRTFTDIQQSRVTISNIDEAIQKARADLENQIREMRQTGDYNALLEKQAQLINQLAALMEEADQKLVSFGDTLAYLDISTKTKGFTASTQWKLNALLERYKGAKKFLGEAIVEAKQLAAVEEPTPVRQLIEYPARKAKVGGFIDIIADLMTSINQYISELDVVERDATQLELELGV